MRTDVQSPEEDIGTPGAEVTVDSFETPAMGVEI